MKVVHLVSSVLGATFLAGLIACSSAAPQSATEAAGVQGTNGPGLNSTTSSSPASSTPASSTAAVTDGGVAETDASTDTTATTAAVPQTCDTLATAAATPAGQLQVTSAHGINPVDVYATQDDQQLTIVLTETANECGYRLNNLAHASMNELRIIVATPQGGFVPGTFSPSETESEQGQVCFPQTNDNNNGFGGGGFGGTSESGGTARGTVTITAIDASSVTGTVDVRDFNGRETSFTFTAPLCPEVSQDQTQGATCCADPNQ